MSTDDSTEARAFLRRRRRNVTGGRTRKIEVKVTDAERERLRIAAEEAGVSVQRLMVSRALHPVAGVGAGRQEKVDAWQQAVDMRNLVAGIGVNMNQIARQANADREVPPEFGGACAGVDRALERVTAAFGEVFNDPSTRIGE